jgi:undecaprenyl-diphosphatase
MDGFMLELFRAMVLGIVEGVTEFLPISSTGHLLLCEKWMGIDLDNDPFWKLFAVFIQIGAILAVVVYFRQRLAALLRQSGLSVPKRAAPAAEEPERSIWRLSPLWLVLLATVPALVIGKLADHWVDKHMGTPAIIALALAVGGVVMAAIEFWRPAARTHRMEHMSLRQAMIVGLTQVLAILFPGTSRSAATIMPGMLAGLSRETAAEFSFFLAIPAMFAACGYKLLTTRAPLNAQNVMLLTVGTLVSFLVAWSVIAAFMGFIRRYSFMPFAVYRVVLGTAVLMVVR